MADFNRRPTVAVETATLQLELVAAARAAMAKTENFMVVVVGFNL